MSRSGFGLLDPEYINSLKDLTWQRNNPIHTCAPPPRRADFVGVIAVCPVYRTEVTIRSPRGADFGSPDWEFDCPICNFEHSVGLDSFEVARECTPDRHKMGG